MAHFVTCWWADAVVARLSRHPRHERRVRREWATAAEVPRAVIAVPLPGLRSSVKTACGRSGFLVERCFGRTQLDRDQVELSSLVALLTDFQATRTAGLTLPGVREWAGGPLWPEVVGREILPLLGRCRDATRKVVESVLAAEKGTDRAVLVHGDFGLHNVLWTDDFVTGLVDLDCCTVGDPVIDLAPSSVSSVRTLCYVTFPSRR